jgi:predicted enzyme related to lactoylglutathione lyase
VEREPRPPLAIRSLTFDCADPRVLAPFWAAALGYRLEGADQEVGIAADPAGGRPRLLFLRVPEPKSAKNRRHLDLRGGDMEAEVARLVSLGATVVRAFEQPGDTFTVMRDPEGNQFCVEQASPAPADPLARAQP